MIVRVRSFADPQFDPLPGAQRDALRIYDYLRDEAEFDMIWLLTNEEATLQRIREIMLDELQPNVDVNDRVIFYFTGHGVSERFGSSMRGFLPVSGSDRARLSSMMSMRELRTWADSLQEAHQLLFVLDSCVSGLAGDVMMQEMDPNIVRDLGRRGHHLLTAGTGDQNAYATADGSYFTRVFLDGIRGAADATFSVREPDGAVSVSELTLYIRQRLRTELADRNYLMTPQRTILNNHREGEFFFARMETVSETPLLAGETTQGLSGGPSDSWLIQSTLELEPSDALGPLIISPDARYIAGTVRDSEGLYRGTVWDAETGLVAANFENVFPSLMDYHLIDDKDYPPGFFAMSSRELRWWEWSGLGGWTILHDSGGFEFSGHPAARSAIFDPQRRTYYVGHDAMTLSVWSRAGEYLGNIEMDNTAPVHDLRLDLRNGRILVEQGGWIYLLESQVWRQGEETETFAFGTQPIQNVSTSNNIYESLADFSPDEGLIATYRGGFVYPENGEPLYQVTGVAVWTLEELASFTYDDGADPVVQFVPGDAPLVQALFSSDAKVIYTLDEAGDLFGWYTSTGAFNYPQVLLSDRMAASKPMTRSARREKPRHRTVVPGGGSLCLSR